MPSRSYDRLDIETFGEHLIKSGDLDPVYVALAKSGYPDNADGDLRKRWLLAYWCFYDCGVSSWMAQFEGEAYWAEMLKAAKNEEPSPVGERWRRAKERRHFRGKQAVKAVESLMSQYREAPEQMADYCMYGEAGGPLFVNEDEGITCKDVMKRAKGHYLFGDWIAFKVADMLERIMSYDISFTSAEVLMFKDPQQAALILWRQRAKLPEDAKIHDEPKAILEVITHLINHFSDLKAPPRNDRPIDFQEAETVLCKWKSHLHGHYPLNNDIIEIRDSLVPWAEISPIAKTFLGNMPEPLL